MRIYLFISQIITPDMNKKREKLRFWRSHCSSPMKPSTSALDRKEPLYRSSPLVGRGRDPRRGEWQIESYMDGKGHCNKSNLGNWEQVQHCYRLEKNTKSKQTEQSKRQNFLHMRMWQTELWNHFGSLQNGARFPLCLDRKWSEKVSIYSGQ